MSKHKLTYIDLHPEAMATDAPCIEAQILGAIVASAALYVLAIVLLSL